MKIFLDTEFTGLHQNTSLISIGLVDEDDRMFYAEFKDYDENQIDDWLRENVLDTLWIKKGFGGAKIKDLTYLYNYRGRIVATLKNWFAIYNKVEMWSDCLSYD